MAKLENGTWVLIADGEKALFMVNETDAEDPFLQVFREEEQDNPPNRDQAANRRGRFHDGPWVPRSAVDEHRLASAVKRPLRPRAVGNPVHASPQREIR